MTTKNDAEDSHDQYPWSEQAASIEYGSFDGNEYDPWLSAVAGAPSERKLQAILKGEQFAQQLIAQQAELTARLRLLEGPHAAIWRRMAGIEAEIGRRTKDYQVSSGLEAEASLRLLHAADQARTELIESGDFRVALLHCIKVLEDHPEWPGHDEQLARCRGMIVGSRTRMLDGSDDDTETAETKNAEHSHCQPENKTVEKPANGGKRGRNDNLKRAIFDAWDRGLSVNSTASEVFDYLVQKDDTGYIRGRDGDELMWVNTSGKISRTTLAKLANRLNKYRVEWAVPREVV